MMGNKVTEVNGMSGVGGSTRRKTDDHIGILTSLVSEWELLEDFNKK